MGIFAFLLAFYVFYYWPSVEAPQEVNKAIHLSVDLFVRPSRTSVILIQEEV